MAIERESIFPLDETMKIVPRTDYEIIFHCLTRSEVVFNTYTDENKNSYICPIGTSNKRYPFLKFNGDGQAISLGVGNG